MTDAAPVSITEGRAAASAGTTAASIAAAREWRVDDFDYRLPEELIAQAPPEERDGGRLLVLDRATGERTDGRVRDLPAWLDPGDLLVANNSRVLPARLSARKATTGGSVELLLLRPEGDAAWTALAKPTRRLRPGTRLVVPAAPNAALPEAVLEVVGIGDGGEVTVSVPPALVERLGDYGETPLPPYVKERLDEPDRYQTIYASAPGSAAAPTAGLHVSSALLAESAARGIGWAEVTLHVGLDTFRPVTVDRVCDHRMHREWWSVPAETARAVAAAKRERRRVVAVGTTAARVLETLASVWDPERPAAASGWSELFIVPGYRWRAVDALLTNFHVPRSTLLMMVAAFAGREQVLTAYTEAIDKRYRFFSFGDAMLIR